MQNMRMPQSRLLPGNLLVLGLPQPHGRRQAKRTPRDNSALQKNRRMEQTTKRTKPMPRQPKAPDFSCYHFDAAIASIEKAREINLDLRNYAEAFKEIADELKAEFEEEREMLRELLGTQREEVFQRDEKIEKLRAKMERMHSKLEKIANLPAEQTTKEVLEIVRS
jgi:hypothetical protein